jgi:FtsP/CotA-like multicopper oxidase with cupredoxin domain
VENQLLEFRVQGNAADPSEVPDFFRPYPPIIIPDNVVRRHWRFQRGNGMWQINDELWDPEIDHREPQLSNPRHQIRRDATEIWTLENFSGGWVHPIHIHLEEGQILSVNGRAPSGSARARKDVYHLGENAKVELFMRFRDFPEDGYGVGQGLGEYTRYVMHCHNMTHEDHAMMVTWNVVP